MTTRWTLALAACLALFGGAIPVEGSTRARLAEGTTSRDVRLQSQLDAGEIHGCAVKNDGTIRCWGSNLAGQLGDGSTTDRLTPVTVSNITTAVAVSAGLLHTCALLVGGTVRCWGANTSGQLGDGTTSERHTPVTVKGLTGAIAVSAGDGHSCALIHDGSVRCWGRNADGQLGDGTRTDRHTPVAVSGLTSVTALAAGVDHSCAVLANGTMRCWGFNAYGQLGDGTTTRRLTPVTVAAFSGDPFARDAFAVAVAASNHTCAISAFGSVLCWGLNADGQLGDGSTTNRSTPPDVGVSGVVGATAVSTGSLHTCVLDDLHRARCWGDNAFGEVGDGTLTDRRKSVEVTGLGTALAITVGGGHSCALQADGSLRCWGLNVVGELGDGTTSASSTPTVVSGGSGGISARDVAAGGSHTCAVRASGAAACWGRNTDGELGDGTQTSRLSPVEVSGLSNVSSITAGRHHSCAAIVDGHARCWGANGSGQVGDGTTTDRSTPVNVSLFATRGGVSAGGDHTCAEGVLDDSECWGRNADGQLGDGTTTDRHTATGSGLSQLVGVSAGEAHSCWLFANGTVECSGDNTSGQLGDGTTVRRTTATAVAGLSNAIAIAVGGSHSCALRADGTVRCWGENASGQLGDGTAIDRLTPVTVSGLSGVVALAAGFAHTCALRFDGTARCWGFNASGQLGNASTTDRSTPVTVSGLSNAVAISAGNLHTCAVRVDGAVLCWGENGSGQVGNNSTTDRTTPVEVSSFRANVEPDATLASNGTPVLLTALVNCPAGDLVTIDMTLTQGAVVGTGHTVDRCTGGLTEYPVVVTTRRGERFHDGSALAEITADVEAQGQGVEVHEWSREVQIASASIGAFRLSGSAQGLGRGPERGRLGLIERVTVTAPLDLASPVVTVTIAHLLNEIQGAGELVDGLPLTLRVEPGNDAALATFSTTPGARPVVRLSIRARSRGVLDLVLKLTGAAIDRPVACTPTMLMTSVTIDDGINPAVVLPLAQAWNCATRGGQVEYLRTP